MSAFLPAASANGAAPVFDAHSFGALFQDYLKGSEDPRPSFEPSPLGSPTPGIRTNPSIDVNAGPLSQGPQSAGSQGTATASPVADANDPSAFFRPGVAPPSAGGSVTTTLPAPDSKAPLRNALDVLRSPLFKVFEAAEKVKNPESNASNNWFSELGILTISELTPQSPEWDKIAKITGNEIGEGQRQLAIDAAKTISNQYDDLIKLAPSLGMSTRQIDGNTVVDFKLEELNSATSLEQVSDDFMAKAGQLDNLLARASGILSPSDQGGATLKLSGPEDQRVFKQLLDFSVRDSQSANPLAQSLANAQDGQILTPSEYADLTKTLDWMRSVSDSFKKGYGNLKAAGIDISSINTRDLIKPTSPSDKSGPGNSGWSTEGGLSLSSEDSHYLSRAAYDGLVQSHRTDDAFKLGTFMDGLRDYNTLYGRFTKEPSYSGPAKKGGLETFGSVASFGLADVAFSELDKRAPEKGPWTAGKWEGRLVSDQYGGSRIDSLLMPAVDDALASVRFLQTALTAAPAPTAPAAS